MKHFAFLILASGLIWTGCLDSDGLGSSASAQRNIENLARISVGMSDREVFQIMRHPYRNEVFDIEGTRYDVWFYVTKFTLMTQTEMAYANLTPLVFKNGVLEGKGYNYYHEVIKLEAAEVQQEKTKPSNEDYDLEKALKAPPQKTPAAPQKPVAPPPQTPAQTPAKQGQKEKKSSTPTQTVPQPKATQPPAPKQPAAPTQALPPPPPPSGTQPSKTPSSSPSSSKTTLSMSKPAPKEPPPEEPKKDKVPITEDDEKMIQEEQQENFDYW